MYSAALTSPMAAYYYRCIDQIHSGDLTNTDQWSGMFDTRGKGKLRCRQIENDRNITLDLLLSNHELPTATNSMH
jgi:hypothetical protein